MGSRDVIVLPLRVSFRFFEFTARKSRGRLLAQIHLHDRSATTAPVYSGGSRSRSAFEALFRRAHAASAESHTA
jgi:hypothetical protein